MLVTIGYHTYNYHNYHEQSIFQIGSASSRCYDFDYIKRAFFVTN